MSSEHLNASLAAVAILALTVGYTASGTPRSGTAEVLRGRGLELTDDKGTVRCRINVEQSGEVVLRMMDERGTIRVKLGADEDGSGMALLDEATEPAIHMIARRDSRTSGRKTTSITLSGPKGTQRVITP